MPRADLDDPFKQLSLTVAPNIFETALFGVFSLLCLLSTCVLARRGLGSRPYALLMSVILIMYSCGAAHWALSTATLIRLIMDPSASTIPPKITLTISLACLGMNILLSDAIVLWRAHLVSGRNFFFLVVSGCLYIAKFAILVVNLWRRARYGVPGCCMSDTTSSMGTLMPLLINIWATSLFLRKALADQRDITMYIRNSATWASFTHKVMVLLVESGIFYGMIWAVMFAVSFANADNMRTSTAPPSTIYCLLSFGMVQIAGIYPTIVVVIICLWQSTDGASINGIHLASHTPLSTLSPQVIAPPVRKAGIMRGSLIITEATVARRASLRAAISVDVESLGRHDHDPLVILRDHQKFEGSAT